MRPSGASAGAAIALLLLAGAAGAGRDLVPPTTSATVAAVGANSVRITLRARDRGGSGVRGIHYALETWRSFRVYRGPFVIRRGVLVYLIAFDRAGNQEDIKQVRGVPGARVEPLVLPKPNPEARDESLADQNIRVAVPAIEAYNADHDGYTGMTLAKLRSYDLAITGIEVLSASRDTYCVRSRVGRAAVYKNGPSGEITRTRCR